MSYEISNHPIDNVNPMLTPSDSISVSIQLCNSKGEPIMPCNDCSKKYGSCLVYKYINVERPKTSDISTLIKSRYVINAKMLIVCNGTPNHSDPIEGLMRLTIGKRLT